MNFFDATIESTAKPYPRAGWLGKIASIGLGELAFVLLVIWVFLISCIRCCQTCCKRKQFLPLSVKPRADRPEQTRPSPPAPPQRQPSSPSAAVQHQHEIFSLSPVWHQSAISWGHREHLSAIHSVPNRQHKSAAPSASYVRHQQGSPSREHHSAAHLISNGQNQSVAYGRQHFVKVSSVDAADAYHSEPQVTAETFEPSATQLSIPPPPPLPPQSVFSGPTRFITFKHTK